MNITELARRLKITTNQLHEALPQMGFDLGRRAIKVDDAVAHKIIGGWSKYIASVNAARAAEEAILNPIAEADRPVIALPPVITVRDFAVKLNLPVTKVVSTLMNNGILAAMNEKIDLDTASIIAEDLGFVVTPEEVNDHDIANNQTTDDLIKTTLEAEDVADMKTRPPVVVVLGHVDHGKTKLLDAIRNTNVMGGEAGGITQHIGAYQVEVSATPTSKIANLKQRVITFIDTPGHEAFTMMRSRGAKIADIAILVIAADDGIKPQTVEAIKIIQSAGLPIIVAINKIDKEEANIDRVKRELSDNGIIPEDWGGKVPCVPISAKQGTNINELLEMVLLLADMDKEKIVANAGGKTLASVIESHIDRNEGPVATILIQNGTLKQNDYLVVNNTLYGKVRAIRDYRGQILLSAIPSQPVKIIGLKTPPVVGDIVCGYSVLPDGVSKDLDKRASTSAMVVSPRMSSAQDKAHRINIILKADTLGSLEAVASSLLKIQTKEIAVCIISKDLGRISTTDVLNAESTGALVAGFQVSVSPSARDLAVDKNVEIKLYKVIYDLVDEVHARGDALLSPEISRVVYGQAKILAVFRSEHNSMILGANVVEGYFDRNCRVKISRGTEVLGEGKLTRLQIGKQEVPKAESGQEFGMNFEGKVVLQVGDTVESFREEKKQRTIEDTESL